MPPFGTAIQQLSGEVGTLDTRNSQPAKVDIKGKVDKYAPVTIAGELDPFDPLKKLDITTSFKRVEPDHPDALFRQVRRLPHPQGATQPGPALPDRTQPTEGGKQGPAGRPATRREGRQPGCRGPAGEAGGSPAQGHQGQHRYPVAGGRRPEQPGVQRHADRLADPAQPGPARRAGAVQVHRRPRRRR